MQKKDYDAMAKVAVIGDSSVGKTNLLLRYVNADYTQSHIATIGIDFKVKTTQVNGFRIKLQIWDTAGQQRFRNLTGTIYQGAQAVLLTYSINNRRSFDNLHTWLQDVRNFANQHVIIAIAATKCDLEAERAVEKSEGQAMADKIGARFVETSAKNNINVEDVFQGIAIEMHKRLTQKSQTSMMKSTKGKAQQRPSKQIEEPTSAALKPTEKKMKLKKQQTDSSNKRKKCC